MPPGRIAEDQLARQRRWLGDSWKWLLRTFVLESMSEEEKKPTALDVGCGPGLVMEMLSPYLEVQGVDIDAEVVQVCQARQQKAIVARAENLPFDDGSFDIVYCSFLLLWVDDAEVVVREMARVARYWVLCLAEPDYGGRVSYPPGVAEIDDALIKGLRRLGADPEMGRKVSGIMSQCGMVPAAGTYAGMWAAERMNEESEREWEEIAHLTSDILEHDAMTKIKREWDLAVAEGSLVQYNPVFYALAKKDANRS